MLRRQLPLWSEGEIESLAARGYFESFALGLASYDARMLAEVGDGRLNGGRGLVFLGRHRACLLNWHQISSTYSWT